MPVPIPLGKNGVGVGELRKGLGQPVHIHMEGNAATQQEATGVLAVGGKGGYTKMVVGLQGSQPGHYKVARTQTGP